MSMSIIHIFTVCTGSYNDFWNEERIQRLNYLFPTYKKSFNLISDIDNIYKFKYILNKDEYCYFNYYHICNLTYPFVTLHKYDYIYDMCKELKYNKYDFFVYFDAHSWILEKEQSYWDNIVKNQFGQYDICYTRNPYYHHHWIVSEEDARSKHYIDADTMWNNIEYWSQASYMSGTIIGLQKLKNSINQLLLDDIKYTTDARQKQCILPNFMEQHYINYVFFDILLNSADYGFSIYPGKYVCKEEFPEDYDDAYLFCHYYGMDQTIIENVLKKHNDAKYDDNL